MGFSTEDYNLTALQANSEILLILRESFAKMLDREAFFITSFQETQSFKNLKGLDTKVCFPVTSLGMHANILTDCGE